jgi:hypothetical protein
MYPRRVRPAEVMEREGTVGPIAERPVSPRAASSSRCLRLVVAPANDGVQGEGRSLCPWIPAFRGNDGWALAHKMEAYSSGHPK